MKKKSKPERKEHESMMKKVKKIALSSTDPKRVQESKRSMKKLKALKSGYALSNKHHKDYYA